MALAAREGVLVKGAQYLERLAKTDVIIFDKTGTLTSGVPEVVEVVTARGVKESTLMKLCASAEARHDHPVARALKSYAQRTRHSTRRAGARKRGVHSGTGTVRTGRGAVA